MRTVFVAALALAIAIRESLTSVAKAVDDLVTAGSDALDQFQAGGEGGGQSHAEPPIPQAGELASAFRAQGGNPGPIPDDAIYVGWAIPTVDVDPILDEVYGTFLARGGKRVTGPEGAPVSPLATWDGTNWVA